MIFSSYTEFEIIFFFNLYMMDNGLFMFKFTIVLFNTKFFSSIHQLLYNIFDCRIKQTVLKKIHF